MQLKGVCYDAGRRMMGQDWRPDFDPPTVRREIEIIHRDLHCNAIRIQGADLARLETASRFALAEGLEVWFSPELWDRSPEETQEYLARGAEIAQSLLDRAPEKVVLSVGSEVILFSKGFIPGENVLERLAHPKLRELILAQETQSAVASFVSGLAATARRAFRGRITYASVAMEQVDWGAFDYLGADLYRGDPMYDRYPELLHRYASKGKPLVNTEFGCCTFRGADHLGGRGWEIVDFSPLPQKPPKLRGNYVYDQTAQANELSTLLRMNDEAGVYGTFVFTFVEPGAGVPTEVDPRMLASLDFDPDISRYSLVKTWPDHRRGTTYPDLPWEPKASFHAVADYYATH